MGPFALFFDVGPRPGEIFVSFCAGTGQHLLCLFLGFCHYLLRLVLAGLYSFVAQLFYQLLHSRGCGDLVCHGYSSLNPGFNTKSTKFLKKRTEVFTF